MLTVATHSNAPHPSAARCFDPGDGVFDNNGPFG